MSLFYDWRLYDAGFLRRFSFFGRIATTCSASNSISSGACSYWRDFKVAAGISSSFFFFPFLAFSCLFLPFLAFSCFFLLFLIPWSKHLFARNPPDFFLSHLPANCRYTMAIWLQRQRKSCLQTFCYQNCLRCRNSLRLGKVPRARYRSNTNASKENIHFGHACCI